MDIASHAREHAGLTEGENRKRRGIRQYKVVHLAPGGSGSLNQVCVEHHCVSDMKDREWGRGDGEYQGMTRMQAQREDAP